MPNNILIFPPGAFGGGGGGGGSSVVPASQVVASTRADQPLTQAGLAAAVAALPAAGGDIYIGAGALSITATIITGKNVRLFGPGSGALEVTIAAGITAFEVGAFKFSVKGITWKGSATSRLIKKTGIATILLEDVHLISSAPVFGTFMLSLMDNNSFAGRITISDCTFALTTSFLENVAGASPILRMVDSVVSVGGADITLPAFSFVTACSLDSSTMTFGGGHFASVAIIAATVSIGGGTKFTNCDLAAICTITGSSTKFTNCSITSWATTGTDNHILNGNRFSGAGSNVVLNDSIENVVVGNSFCTVTETGTSDFNIYDNNENFFGSVIIGPNSIVNGWLRKDVTGAATVDALTLVFTHHNEKALEGSGSIKNTGAASLTIRREVLDAYGTTATIDDVVLAGASFNWRVGEAIGAALPPFETFSVYVRSTVAGVPTTYSLRHGSVGVESV